MTDETMTGGCYCKAIRFKASGPVSFRATCHCRPCQYISGGGPNFFLLMSAADFQYEKGVPAAFTRPDLDVAVTREFCPACGTHLITRLPDGERVVIKVGTLDDPARDFGAPMAAIHTRHMQPFHTIAEGQTRFPDLPGDA